MKKLTIKVSNDELDALEDALMAWTLCNKHNQISDSEIERFAATRTCKQCIKMNNTIERKAFGIWHKLVVEYDK